MFVFISAILVVVGIGVVFTACVIKRRIEAWADAMILSFGLPPAEIGEFRPGLTLPASDKVPAPSSTDQTVKILPTHAAAVATPAATHLRRAVVARFGSG